MDTETWASCLRWLAYFVAQGTQGELVLSGTGEPTLHPNLAVMAREARAILGPHRRLMTTTNGIAVTPELVDALRPSNVRVYVSLHQPVKTKRAISLLREAGLFEEAVADFLMGSNTWAGQVDWDDDVNRGGMNRPVCPWLSRGWLFVASDGTCYPCCYANGDTSIIGHISGPVQNVTPQPWAVCPACWQRPPLFRELSPEVTR